MNTHIAYFDETGDDGVLKTSSEIFVLTSLCMDSEKWQSNFEVMKNCRRYLKDNFGLPVKVEMHTNHFLTDKNPYRNYGWSIDDRLEILRVFTYYVGQLDASVINVIIDKQNIKKPDTYDVLKNALTYSIQRIENDSKGDWNYLIISDKGRIATMRRTARAICKYNPIPSAFDYSYTNAPIRYMVEDIMEKDSSDSYFIQVCDFISCFVNLYYKSTVLHLGLPNRVKRLLDSEILCKIMDYYKKCGLFNLNANHSNEYGFVIYPKK